MQISWYCRGKLAEISKNHQINLHVSSCSLNLKDARSWSTKLPIVESLCFLRIKTVHNVITVLMFKICKSKTPDYLQYNFFIFSRRVLYVHHHNFRTYSVVDVIYKHSDIIFSTLIFSYIPYRILRFLYELEIF